MRNLRKRNQFGWAGIACLLSILTGCGGSSPPPPNITISFSGGSTQTLGQGQTAAITAIIANDSSGKGVRWSLSGPGSLTQQTSTSVEYDSPASITGNGSATITATAVADSTKSAIYT